MSTEARHLPGLDAANVVKTKAFISAEHKLSSAVSRHGIAVVSGAPGNGKSFTVDRFLRTHPVVTGRTVHWLDMPPNPAPKEVTVRLLSATAIPFNSRDTLYELTELLIPALDGQVVVIDEAQNLKQNALQQVRYFHDQGRAMALPWALILVGSTIDSAMSRAPELHSRVAARVEFEAMDAESLLRAVRDWHPATAALDPKLVLQVDATYGYGNWRRWGQLLSALLDLMSKLPDGTPVTAQHVAAALSVVQG